MSFDWIPPGSPDRLPLISRIPPTDILYELDEPILFLASSDYFPVLCYKIDSDLSCSQYIVVPTNLATIGHLRAGHIPLHSAIVQPWAWIVEADDKSFDVARSWGLSSEVIPKSLLPSDGVGLYHRHGVIHNKTISQNTSYLSVKFRGGEAKNGTLPFWVIKNAVYEVYNSFWRIFAPAVQHASKNVAEKTLRRVVNIPTHEMVHASLLIAIERPEIDLGGIRNRPDVDVPLAQSNIEKAQHEFLESTMAIASAVDRNHVTQGLASDHFNAIEALSEIIPSQNSFFDSVEINGLRAEKPTIPLVITVEYGRILKGIYHTVSSSPRDIAGEIFLVNSQSYRFTIRTGYREVTCIATNSEQRRVIPFLRNGMHVSVRGHLQKRTNRDLLEIQNITIDGRTIT